MLVQFLRNLYLLCCRYRRFAKALNERRAYVIKMTKKMKGKKNVSDVSSATLGSVRRERVNSS